MTIKSYIEEIIDKDNQEDMNELSKIFIKLFSIVEDYEPETAEHIECDLYEILNGETITEQKAITLVNNMKPVGMHWTLEQTKDAKNRYGYQDDDIEYFVASNMQFNDYYDELKTNDQLAFKLAHSWLNDIDANDNKLYLYQKHIVKK